MNDKHKTSPARAAQQAGGDDANAGLRRQQDLAADVLQLKEALREARLLVEESQAHGEALDQERRDALVAAEDARARTRVLQEEFETLRGQFEFRIAELRSMLDALRPREGDPARRDSGTA